MAGFFKLLFGVAIIAAIGVLSINQGRLPGSAASARDALWAKTDAAIAEADAPWAQVSLEGQKIVVRGEAPSADALAKLKTELASAAGPGGPVFGGITSVDASGVSVVEGPPPADPFIWAAEHEGGDLSLSGYAPSQPARDAVLQLAAMRFPGRRIAGELQLASGGPPEDAWLAAVSASLQALAQLEAGKVDARGAQFSINGVAADELRAAAVRDYMERLDGGVTGTSEVRIKAPASAASPLETETDESFEEEAPTSALEATAGEEAVAEVTTAAPPTPEPMIDDCRPRLEVALDGVDISFDTSRAALDEPTEDALRSLATVLLVCPQYTLAITGHTDSRGDSRRNQRLSLERAEAVAAFLADAGVEVTRLRTSGAGEIEPVGDNGTEAGRAQNRRIEFELMPAEQE